jgi:hypothetical protein
LVADRGVGEVRRPDREDQPGRTDLRRGDLGGERSASAVVWCTEDLRVDCRVFHGDGAVFECADQVRELGETFTIAEVAFDPWRFEAPALELAERGIPVVAASERLHVAIVEGRLTHRDSPDLNAHVRAAIARDTPRGCA